MASHALCGQLSDVADDSGGYFVEI